MIRINLLSVEKPVAKTRSFNFKIGDKVGQILAISVLAAFAVYVGWDYTSVSAEDARLRSDLVAARAEKQRLAPILKEVERYDARRKELQQRVVLIEELRKNQSGPVHMLDEISSSLPDRLWLTEMKQTGDDMQMDGRTSSLSALADLVANLEASGYFKKPVEIISSEEEKNDDKDLIKFSIKATFEMPGSKPPAAPSAPGAPASKRLAE
jgi:type IV pilus assembly protein PilN